MDGKLETKLQRLALWLKNSKYAVVLSGAGMSTESGIPDFRSANGWWKKTDPQFVASIEALERYYDMFHEFYSMRIRELKKHEPNIGHEIIAKWERKGLIKSIITQNVDGFHQMAGSQSVYEIHGSINSIRCNRCNRGHPVQNFLDKKVCSVCSGKLRPNVVLFGETLPVEPLNKSISSIKECDLLIIIGTSLSVYPANQLHEGSYSKKVYINEEISGLQYHFDLELAGKAGKLLSEVDELVSG